MAEEREEMERLPDPHGHPPADDNSPPGRHEIMAHAMKELLIEKGVFTGDQLRAQLERIDSWQPSKGAQIVARAWTDADFKDRLIADSKAAAAEIGLDIGPIPILVMENTRLVHNLIVCTLCSCYPRFLLGLPPDWYKSRSYRRRAISEPRKVLAEFGTDIGGDIELRVGVIDRVALVAAEVDDARLLERIARYRLARLQARIRHRAVEVGRSLAAGIVVRDRHLADTGPLPVAMHP